MLMMGLRLGPAPRCIVATTPKPISIIRKLVSREGEDVFVTRGSTYANRANLAPAFFQQIVSQYEGTRLGQQEIYAQLLDEAEGALWTRDLFIYNDQKPEFDRIVVAIDPAATSEENSDETGIIVAGIDHDRRGWVLDDLSGRYSPDKWARAAIGAYEHWQADRIIGESNNGGEMIEAVLRSIDSAIPYKAVHASKGKAARAEPIAALYEQHRVTHIRPFDALEDQMCSWEPLGKHRSPDRLDAAVWAFTELMLNGGGIDVDEIELIGELSSARPDWDIGYG